MENCAHAAQFISQLVEQFGFAILHQHPGIAPLLQTEEGDPILADDFDRDIHWISKTGASISKLRPLAAALWNSLSADQQGQFLLKQRVKPLLALATVPYLKDVEDEKSGRYEPRTFSPEEQEFAHEIDALFSKAPVPGVYRLKSPEGV